MRKAASVFLVVLCMMVGMSGCVSGGGPKNVEPVNAESVGEKSTNQEPNGTEKQKVEAPNQAKTIYEKLEDGLNGAGIQYETVTMAAELVGAKEGRKYKLSTGNVEVYRFDNDSDALKEAVKNKAITLEGFGAIPVEIKENYAIINNAGGSEHDVAQSVIDGIFK